MNINSRDSKTSHQSDGVSQPRDILPKFGNFICAGYRQKAARLFADGYPGEVIRSCTRSFSLS